MKKTLTVFITLLVLAIGNWVAAYALQFSFIDIAIPFGGLALVIIYFFKSKGGMASRRMDMAIQGQTGIRMDEKVIVTDRSYIFIGAVLYFIVALGSTFFIYRDFF